MEVANNTEHPYVVTSVNIAIWVKYWIYTGEVFSRIIAFIGAERERIASFQSYITTFHNG